MGRYLECGEKLNIQEKGEFVIKEIMGKGSSCVVYLAEYTDAHGICTEHLLKEYNPRNIEMYREGTGELCLDTEDDREAYEQGMQRFEEGYKKQLSVRRELSGLKNVTSNIQEIYYGNGTRYIDMTCNEGVSYEKLQETSLFELLRRMKGLAKIIGNYHKAGLLHLDIKPQNIFAIPETAEMVLLFDFDSVVRKEEVADSNILSYTQSWAAPEQVRGQRSLVCEATDIFAIGEMLFYEMFGRHSELEERRSFAEYAFDYEAELFKNVNPKIYRLLEDILHNTICRAVKERYQSTEDLIVALDEAIKLADPKEPYLMTNLPTIQNFFVGRDSEIEEIHQRLQENNVLFVSGVGGIGKSELVKNYAKKYREEYDAVIFAPFVSSIKMAICDDLAVPVCNFESEEGEPQEEYFLRKMKKIQELCDARVLFIMDNLDQEDDDLGKILELGCNILITTRMKYEEFGFRQISVRALKNRDDVSEIFENYYKKALDEEKREHVKKIIELVDGHTMTVELLAKQMLAGRVTPEKMLEKLQSGFKGLGKEKVHSSKDGVLASKNSYEHIKMLFDISELNEEEKYILANLSLLPYTGISAELFYNWCKLESYEDINSLVLHGWLRWDEENDYISLHPVIMEIGRELLQEDKALCNNMLVNILMHAEKRGNQEQVTSKQLAMLCMAVCTALLKLGECSDEIINFLNLAPEEFWGFGNLELAIKCRESALKMKLEQESQEDTVLSGIYDNLGMMYQESGDIDKAEDFYMQAFEIGKRVYKDNMGEFALSYNNMGHLYEEKGLFDRAMDFYKEGLEISLKWNGEHHEDTALLLNNLGGIYLQKGELEETRKCCLKALDIKQALYGEMHEDVAEMHNNLGVIYEKEEKFDEAYMHYEKALCIVKEVCGETFIGAAFLYSNMSVLIQKKGNYELAEEYALKSLDIITSLYGEKHMQAIRNYYNMGILYKKQNRFELAERYFDKVINVSKEHYGEVYYDALEAYKRLAEIYEECNQEERAKICMQKAEIIQHRMDEEQSMQ